MNLSAGRAVLRISRRNVARAKWRSALIVVLVMLPVTGMVGAVTLLRTTTQTPEARAVSAMGRADLLVYPGSRDASTQDLRSILPAGSHVEAITFVDTRLILPGRQLRVTERSLDLDGLAQGMLSLVAGAGLEPRQLMVELTGAVSGEMPVIGTALKELRDAGVRIVLDDFGVRGEIVKVRPGPVVTLYELEPAPGTKTSRVSPTAITSRACRAAGASTSLPLQ